MIQLLKKMKFIYNIHIHIFLISVDGLKYDYLYFVFMKYPNKCRLIMPCQISVVLIYIGLLSFTTKVKDDTKWLLFFLFFKLLHFLRINFL